MKKIIIIALSIILALSLFGCTSNKDNNVTVLLDWVPNTNHTGMYVALELGFYEEYDLDVEIIQATEGGTAQLVAAGGGDFGVSYQEEVSRARAECIPVKAIAAILQENTSGFASLADKGITRPKDFEGKIYGGWGDPMEEAIIKSLIDEDGGDFDKVEIIIKGAADFFTSVERDTDFEWIYYGWTGIEAELRGIDLNFIKLTDLSPELNFYTPVLITSEDSIRQSPDTVRSFIQATKKGYEYTIENPEEAAQILLKHAPELEEEIVLASQKYLTDIYKGDAEIWGLMEQEVWETFGNWMMERELVSGEFDPLKAYTNEFLLGE